MAIKPSTDFRSQPLQRLDVLIRNLSSASGIDSADIASTAVAKLRHDHPALPLNDALCIVLGEALERLHGRDPLQADLIYGRFWQGFSVAQMVADQRPEPQSERRFFQQQKDAIARLAEIVVAMESQHRQAEIIAAPLRVLPMSTYDRLLGVDDIVDHVRALLAAPDRHFVVTIKGIGGIGKTAVADAVVRTIDIDIVAPGGLVWVSSKQRVLTSSGAVTQNSPFFVDELLDQVATQLNLHHLKTLPTTEKLENLAGRLRKTPHLVVIDNLEEMADIRESIFVVERLAGPTKFLLTSRVALPPSASFTVVELDELAQEAAIELVTHLATTKGIELAAPEGVYAVTGGNPLAIVLTVSQMTLLPPTMVVAGMQSGALPDVFDHIYSRAWSLLSSTDLELLLTILRTGESADSDWLTLLFPGEDKMLFRSLKALTNLSLLQVQMTSGDRRRYSLHRMTTTFLGTGVLGWKSLDWRKRFYDGYQRDGQRLLAHISAGNLGESVIELSLNLLRTYVDLVHSIPGEHQPDHTLLELASKIDAHAMNAGRWTEIRAIWPDLRNLAQKISQEYLYVELTSQLAMVLDRQGDGQSAIQIYEEVSRGFALDKLAFQLRALFRLNAGTAYLWHGYYQQAEEVLTQALLDIGESLEPGSPILKDHSGFRLSGQLAPAWELEAYLLSQMGNLMMFRGDNAEAVRLHRRSLSVLAHHDGTDNLVCVAYQALGRFHLYRREYDEAVAMLQRGLQIRRRRSDQEGIAANSIYLAGAYLEMGKIVQAEACLDEAVPICKRLGNLRDSTLADLYLGYAHWLRSEIPQAAVYWLQVLDSARDIYFHDLELELLLSLPDAADADLLPKELLTRLRQFTHARHHNSWTQDT